MRKIVFCAVLALGMMSFNSSSNKVTTGITTIESEGEFFGCASDCVRSSRELVFDAAAENGDHPNDDPVYMSAYKFLYTNCYYNNCVQ